MRLALERGIVVNTERDRMWRHLAC